MTDKEPIHIYDLSEEEKEILIWYRVQDDNVKDYLRDKTEKETTK